MATRSANFKAYSQSGNGEIWIYDDIGPEFMGMIGAKTIRKALDAIGSTVRIRVHLNSVGGDVVEGVGIYNILAKCPATVDVEIDGAAYSIASVIAMCGDTIKIAENALMMIHNPWTIAVGDAAELRKRAEALDLMREAAIGIYRDRTKNSRTALSQWMDAETWFTADEAIEHRLADVKLPNKAIAAKFDPQAKGFRNAPLIRLAALHVADEVECGGRPSSSSRRDASREIARATRRGVSPADMGQFLRNL
jgi:ATP-dependent Clp protease, protease subunit